MALTNFEILMRKELISLYLSPGSSSDLTYEEKSEKLDNFLDLSEESQKIKMKEYISNKVLPDKRKNLAAMVAVVEAENSLINFLANYINV